MKYSCVMLVLNDQMGQNGLQYGVTANCSRFTYSFNARYEIEARELCETMNVIYDGMVIGTYE